MRFRHLPLLLWLVLLAGVFSTGIVTGGGLADLVMPSTAQPTPSHPDPGPQPFTDAYKVRHTQLRNIAVPGRPDVIPHPCGDLTTDPPFTGVSPLSIAYVPGMCDWGYGDIAVWQAAGHSYVAQSGFDLRMYHIWDVDDPYNPALLITKPFPPGGVASTAVFHFHQFGHEYLATTMRGGGTGCGYFIDNVDNPATPIPVVANVYGTDWCSVHETFVSTDANGDADYAWLSMGIEWTNGEQQYFEAALTLPDLRQPNPVVTETGRYQRPDSCGGLCIFAHDSNVVGNRVYIAHWAGGAIVEDKQTLAHSINPTPLNPIDSIRPANFWVHHLVPTTDGKFLIVEDEFLNQPTDEKIKFYNIENLASPFYVGGITGGDPDSDTSQAHNQIIRNLGPHHDLLLSAYYLAGYRLYDIDTSGSTPVITQIGGHQLRATGGPNFGGVWGVDSLPCTVHGVQTTCIYSSDMNYGLVVDALGIHPSLDPYPPDPATITSPTEGQQIDMCSFAIQGTALHDYWSGVSHVEVSVDNGASWHNATGTANWSYRWYISGSGPFTIMARSVDNAGNVQTTATRVNVNITAGCAVDTPTATPVPPTVVSTNTSTPPATPTNAATVTPATCAITFIDVPPGSTFYPYVRCLACHGIVSGYADGTFRPYNNVTRGQVAKMISPCSPCLPDDGQTFEDVPPGSTFYTSIERWAGQGITGYPCGGPGEPCVPPNNRPYYRPYNNVTRGQVTKFISSAAGWQDMIPADRQTFEDVPPVTTFWVYIERYVLHNSGGITGYPCGGPGETCIPPDNRSYFRPGNNLTRGQASKLVAIVFYPDCPTLR